MKRLVIIVIVLILLGVGVCVGSSLLAPKLIGDREGTPGAQATPSAAQAAAIRARGRLAPARVETLSFAVTGIVGELAVEVGDQVSAGQVLARLDTDELEWAVRQAQDALLAARLSYSQTVRPASAAELAGAEASLSSAQAGLLAAEASLTSAQAGQISARIALTNAIAARDALQDGGVAARAGLKSAQALLVSAQAALTALQAGPEADAVEQARLNWEQARNNLARMQFERDAVQARPGIPGYILEQMRLDIANLEIAVRLAEISYQQAQNATASEQSLAAAQASVAAAEVGVLEAQARVDGIDEQIVQAEAAVAQAQAAVTQAGAGVAQAEAGLLQAQASLAQAQAALDRLQAGPEEIAMAQAALNVAQAEAALERASARLDEVTIQAPFDGMVSAIVVQAGSAAAAGAPAVTVADLSGWLVETEDLDEWAVTHIDPDQAVQLFFTAFDEKILSGHIRQIALNPTVLSSGDVTYKATIMLDTFDAGLRWGMSVRVEFARSE